MKTFVSSREEVSMIATSSCASSLAFFGAAALLSALEDAEADAPDDDEFLGLLVVGSNTCRRGVSWLCELASSNE
jgi:hypothetical protein